MFKLVQRKNSYKYGWSKSDSEFLGKFAGKKKTHLIILVEPLVNGPGNAGWCTLGMQGNKVQDGVYSVKRINQYRNNVSGIIGL